MATRLKCIITFLAAVMVVAVAACAGAPPVPTPNIDATIEAGIAATVVGVAIEKGVKATMAPSAAKEHFNRGIAYGKLGNYQLAIQDYGKVIALYPNDADAYLNRGIAYDKLGNYQLAIQVSSASCRAWLC